jgi:hypothetical protein
MYTVPLNKAQDDFDKLWVVAGCVNSLCLFVSYDIISKIYEKLFSGVIIEPLGINVMYPRTQ